MAQIALLLDSTINKQKSRGKPGYFADTGIPALLNYMNQLGWPGQYLRLDCKTCWWRNSAGILHDIGKAIFSGFINGKPDEIITEIDSEQTSDFLEAKRRQIGIDHCEASFE